MFYLAMEEKLIVVYIRVVSDVGFPIFADADFEFQYLRISDADITYFIILGL